MVLDVFSSFAIILLGKRELIALLHCILADEWLSVFYMSLPHCGVVRLWYVIVVFPGHTHLHFDRINSCM